MKKTSSMQTGVLSLSFLGVMLFGSCTDPFPPYAEPENVLAINLSVTAPDTVHVVFDQFSQTYFYTDPLICKVTVTNTFNQLLQGEALVNGMMVAQSFGDLPRTMVTQLSPADLRNPPIFQGNLALGPGSQAVFSFLWRPESQDGRQVFEGLPPKLEPDGQVFGPIPCQADARIQLFDRVQPIRSEEIKFSVLFKVVTQ